MTQRLTDRLRGLARARGSHAAAGAVREYAHVIPVLAGQVREAASRIEHGVLAVTSRLSSLVQRAHCAVSAARGTRSTDAGGTVDDVIASSRHALQQLLDDSVRRAQLSRDAVARLEEVAGAMTNIGNASKEVDRIAFDIRILALNVKTELEHVGERGASLPAVDEISEQADQAAAVAQDIRGTASGLESNLALATRNLRELAEADLTSLAELEDHTERIIDRLVASATASGQLAEDVARAVVDMQFQERVHQRLQQVVETLSEMQNDFLTALERPDEPAGSAGSAALRLRQRYTAAAVEELSGDDIVELC